MRYLGDGVTVETDQFPSCGDFDPADVVGLGRGHDVEPGDNVPLVILVNDGGIDPLVEGEPEAFRQIRLEGEPAIGERNRDG
jgi:hypothetical protein